MIDDLRTELKAVEKCREVLPIRHEIHPRNGKD
jgi:hypothetical protein